MKTGRNGIFVGIRWNVVRSAYAAMAMACLLLLMRVTVVGKCRRANDSINGVSEEICYGNLCHADQTLA